MSVQQVPSSSVADHSYHAHLAKKVCDPKFPDAIAMQQTVRKVAAIVGLVLWGALMLGAIAAFALGVSPIGAGIVVGTLPLVLVGPTAFVSLAGLTVITEACCLSERHPENIFNPQRAENYRGIQKKYQAIENLSGASLGMPLTYGERLQQIKPLLAARQFWSEKLEGLNKKLGVAEARGEWTCEIERAMYDVKFKVAFLDVLMRQDDLKKWGKQDICQCKSVFKNGISRKAMKGESVDTISRNIEGAMKGWLRTNRPTWVTK